MAIDWDKVYESTGGERKFKNYAHNGTYTVELEKVEITDRPNWKSPAMIFSWKEGEDVKYPRSATHWLSITKPDYRQRHNAEILMAFGIEKEKAKQLVEAAEADQDREKLKKGYAQLYDRVAKRGVKAEIEVRDQLDRNGHPVVSQQGTVYSESDFTAYYARAPYNGPANDQASGDPLLFGAQTDTDEINMDEIPFD